jgi:hypothetical protein
MSESLPPSGTMVRHGKLRRLLAGLTAPRLRRPTRGAKIGVLTVLGRGLLLWLWLAVTLVTSSR